MRVAMLGFGSVARYGHLPWYQVHPEAALVAIVEPTPSGRELAEELVPNARIFSSLSELLHALPIDCVDITAPPAAHFRLIKQALEANLHIFCEKPFVTRRSDFELIKDLYNQSDCVVHCCHNWDYAPAIQQVFHYLHSGEVGEPEMFLFSAFRQSAARGSAHWNPLWRDLKEEEGGVITDLGYHALYLATRIFVSAPTQVHVTHIQRSEDPQLAERAASLALAYGNRRWMQINVDWDRGARETALTILGSQGCIHIRNDNFRLLRQGTPPLSLDFPALTADSWHADWIGKTLDRFFTAIYAREKEQGWHDIVKTMDILEQIMVAAVSSDFRPLTL